MASQSSQADEVLPPCEERKWYFNDEVDTCTNGYEPYETLYDSAEECCAPYYSADFSFCMKNLLDVCLPCSGTCNEVEVCESDECAPRRCDDNNPCPDGYACDGICYPRSSSIPPTFSPTLTLESTLSPKPSFERVDEPFPTLSPTTFIPTSTDDEITTLSPADATPQRHLVTKRHSSRKLQTGTRSVLAVRVIAADGEYGFSEAELSDKVFGTDGDQVNLKSQTAACSFDQLNFIPTPDRELINNPNDRTTNIANGVMSIEIATPVSLQGWNNVMENAITDKINKVFSITSPGSIADHVMYCLPDHGPFWKAAKAYVNSWSSVYNNENCNFVSVQMHAVRFRY